MKNVFTLIVLLFSFASSNSMAQYYIEFITYKQTCAKCVRFELKIDISKKRDTCILKVDYHTYNENLDTSYSIPKGLFDNLINTIIKISPLDVSNSESGKDGGISTIEFGRYGSLVKYEAWSPNYDTAKRKLKPFLDACSQILKLANLNPDKILL